MITDFHIFVKPFSKSCAAGASRKMAALLINVFNYTRFCTICQIKVSEKWENPQISWNFNTMCSKLTMLLLIIHNLSNFVNFFVKKIVPFRFRLSIVLVFAEIWACRRDLPVSIAAARLSLALRSIGHGGGQVPALRFQWRHPKKISWPTSRNLL